MASTDIDDVLNTLGFGRLQLWVFFTCAALQLYVTNEQFGIGLVSVAASCDLDIGSHRMAWLMTTIYLVQVAVSHYMGCKSDTIGRRKLMLITTMMTMLMSFISSLMPDYWSFLVIRFLGSAFLAGPAIGLLTYLSEFTKISLRPKVINYACYAIGLSMIYVPASAMALIPLDKHLRSTGIYCSSSWRVLIMTNLLPGIIACISLFRLPESPKFYLSINQPEKAMEVMEICCRVNKGKDVTLKSLGIESVTQPRVSFNEKKSSKIFLVNMWNDTKPLFKGIYIRQTLNTIVILFILFATGAGLTVWMPRVFKAFDESNNKILCDALTTSQQNKTELENKIECDLNNEKLSHLLIGGCCCLSIYMLISLLLLCINRKRILLAFMLVAGCSGLLLNFVKINIIVVISFIFLSLPPLCSIRLVISVIIDYIPTNLRSKAVAFAMTFGRLGMMASSLFIGYSLDWNCFVTFNTYAAFMFMAAILIFFLPSDSTSKTER